MGISINIPDVTARMLREAWGDDLERAALEALAVEGYRSGKFGSATVGRLLGHGSRWDTERWLADRSMPLDYTLDNLEADRAALDRLLNV